MIRRRFLRTAVAAGMAAGFRSASASGSGIESRSAAKPKYRAGVIGLGWMGLLYDLGTRPDTAGTPPDLDPHRRLYHHQHPGDEGLPDSYSEALWNRPEVELVAGAERDPKRLQLFGERYGIKALYTDAVEMLQKEKLDIVGIATNTKGRSFLTVKAAELGAKAIFVEKPMCHTLEEADRMVKACADRGIPLNGGAISTTHPSFAKAKELLKNGAIGELVAMEARSPGSQHQNWAYFMDSPPAWVVGIAEPVRSEVGRLEFAGQGVMVTQSGLVVHFRQGAPGVRLVGSKGEIVFGSGSTHGLYWRLFQEAEIAFRVKTQPFETEKRPVEMPWPAPQFLYPYGAVYSLDDILSCLEGKLDEPKNSGRRVAMALEVEIAMRESARQGSKRVDLPLADRTLGIDYGWR